MLQRELSIRSHTCPDCGEKLSSERDLLLCKEHGAFFTYGPQLLVRAARAEARPVDALLPWETGRQKVA